MVLRFGGEGSIVVVGLAKELAMGGGADRGNVVHGEDSDNVGRRRARRGEVV
jgi:hypothetical protein